MSSKHLIVFLGPTLPVAKARQVLDATYRPPAAQGDLLRAAYERPWAIGLIDGYFEHVPAVWHKEILWALSQGIHVFGAASMGALRAVETAAFGMQGVGAIYHAYRRGELERDDEVAIVHALVEVGGRPLSEAMVNIRWTLAAAQRAKVIGSELGAELIEIAEETFYADRTWNGILGLARDQSGSQDELDRFAAWLPDGRVDQKQRDALELLLRMRRHSERDDAPFHPRFVFHNTDSWETLRRDTAQRPSPLDSAPISSTTEEPEPDKATLQETP